jgi:hypothetical protein
MAAAAVSRLFIVQSRLTFYSKVERAFKMYSTGECIDPGQFSREKVGNMVAD